MMDGRRLRLGSPTMVIGGHKANHKKELNAIGLGRQWRAVRVSVPTNPPLNGVIARSWKKLLRSEECMEIGLDQTC